MKLIDPNAEFPFVPSSERDKEDPTTFYVKVATQAEFVGITNKQDPTWDRKSDKVSVRSNTGRIMRDFAGAGITRIENIEGDDAPTEFPRRKRGVAYGLTLEVLDDSILDLIPWDELAEVYEFRFNNCTLVQEDEAGKS